MHSHFKHFTIIIYAIVFTTMALLFYKCFINNNTNKHLHILDCNTEKELASFPIENDGHFSISFIHSVNKTPVTDFYRFDNDNNLIVYKTIYYSFGAGVQTELNENENIIYGDDGSMTIEHIDKKIENLTYYISNIYDHILNIDDDSDISIWNIIGKNKLIKFVVS